MCTVGGQLHTVWTGTAPCGQSSRVARKKAYLLKQVDVPILHPVEFPT